jgi:hypothetical protein
VLEPLTDRERRAVLALEEAGLGSELIAAMLTVMRLGHFPYFDELAAEYIHVRDAVDEIVDA